MTYRSKLAQLFHWTGKAWPLFLTGGVGAIHYIALCLLGHPQSVNKLVGAFLQVIGVICVLVAINQNLGTFRNHGLMAMVWGHLRAFPLWRKSVVVPVSGVATVSASGEATVHVKKTCATVDEHIEELYRQIASCIELIHMKDRQQKQQLAGLQANVRDSISGVENRLNRLSSQVEESAVGGISLQVFGILLLLYGAILAVFI